MGAKEKKCAVCGLERQGRGQYWFSYLGETVYLCGKDAREVMEFIKKRILDNGNNTKEK